MPEATTRPAAEVIQENRDYTLFSWSVQANANPVHIERGEGCWFWDGDGNRWLDFSSQLINLNVGHQHPRMLAAIKAQVDKLCFAGPATAHDTKGVLGRMLADVTGLAKSFFTLGGAEAVENAIRIARLYTGRQKIITRYRSYHGGTAGAMAATGEMRRWPSEPSMPGIVRVFDPYCYRCSFGKTPDSCGRECVTHIEEVIRAEGPNNVAAVLVEGITGANGILVPPDDYFPKLRSLCDKYGILLIDDEVMSGFGRTGKYLATQHWNIQPDIVTCAKGLTSGYMPLGAVVVSKQIADFFESNMLWGGLTYSGHPVCCAAGIENLKIYEEEEIFANVERQGRHLELRLEQMKSEHPFVGDVRGKGLFSAIELVKDKVTKEPITPAELARLAAYLRSRFLYVFARYNMVWICPPLIINEQELDFGLDIIEDGIGKLERGELT